MQGPALQDAIDELLSLNGMARYAEMEARAAALLVTVPGACVVRELLGMALAAQQRFAEALPHFERAVRDDPSDPFFWDNLAYCQLQLSQIAAAEATLRQAIVHHPGSASAWAAFADVLVASNRLDEARAALDQVLAIQPGDPAAHFVAGRVAARQRRLADAERHFRHAIAADPGVAAAPGELAALQLQTGDALEAETHLRQAIALDGGNPAYRADLCRALSILGRLDGAVEEAHGLLDLLGRQGGAIDDGNIAFYDIAAAILGVGTQVNEALAIYRKTFQFRKDPLRAVGASYVARRGCDWTFAAETEVVACGVTAERADIDETVPWRLLGFAAATPQVQLAAARRIARHVAANVAQVVRPARATERDRLRIGYYSGDLYDHAVAHLLSGVIESHDRGQFEIIAYDFSAPTRDAYRQRLEAAFDRIVPIGHLASHAAARQIADDGVDIMVDLNGWVRRGRSEVMAARPAPVQVQWLGYAGTLGASWIDYIIADEVVAPLGREADFAEKIVRLPGTLLPIDHNRQAAEMPARAACGLPDEALVLCCFNEAYKITHDVFSVWMQLLQAVPRAVLWLGMPVAEAMGSMLRAAAEMGCAPERFVFAPRVPTVAEHLARMAHADLALDCHPYGSHTTAGDCMWAGVPLVALMGETFASRVAGSVLRAAGAPQLVTHSLGDYRALAQRLATSPEELAGIRQHLKAVRATAPLFDTVRFTRNLEAAFQAMWQIHSRGGEPAHINFAPDATPVLDTQT